MRCNGAKTSWCKSSFSKIFARIHENNLKKQGMLALTFVNAEDYDKIQEDDTFDFINLESFFQYSTSNSD